MRDLNGKNHPHIKRDLGCRVALLPYLSDHTLFVRVTPQGRGERTRAVPSARMSQIPSTPLPSSFIDYQVDLLRLLASLSMIFETRFLQKAEMQPPNRVLLYALGGSKQPRARTRRVSRACCSISETARAVFHGVELGL